MESLEYIRLLRADVLELIEAGLGGLPTSQQRLLTLEQRGAVRPEGGQGKGSRKSHSVLDALCAHYAASYMRTVDSIPVARELGFNAALYLQGLGLERIWDACRQGRTYVLPLITPHDPSSTAALVAGPLRDAAGNELPNPDLMASFEAVRDKVMEVVRREYKVHARHHPTDPEEGERALEELTEMLKARQTVTPKSRRK